MTAHPYLRPTATQKIRTFFDSAGEKVPPWTSFEEVMDTLWTVLYTRRNDGAFWADFEVLVDSLRADLSRGRGEGLPDPKAEILTEDRIGIIIAQLQDAVQRTHHDPKRGAMKRFFQGLSAPLAGCIILMGAAFAAGCEDNAKSDAAAALNQYVDDSNLPAAEKQALRSCFSGLSEAAKEDLVELFKTKPAEEIAAELEAMLAPGGQCYSAPADAGTDADVPPENVPVYKGVTF
ncbi:MAG: hypothetical protein ABIJ56_19070 [Pseudomonadota bacterium]